MPSQRGLADPIAMELGDLLHELSHHKEARKEVARIIRKVKPDSPHAAAFADVDTDDKFEAFKREQEEKELKRAQEEALAGMNKKRSALLNGDGGRKYSEDDLKKIEELMQRKGLTDYEDGATLYAATQPPVDARPGYEPAMTGQNWEFPEFKEFSKNPVKASRDRAHQIIGEFMRKR